MKLYVDGKQSDIKELGNIKPGDIESMTISKDKEDAIYIVLRK